MAVALHEKVQRIADAATESRVARDATHPLYRYPASMSPHIARAAIGEFSQPGDLVLDPFCGGGTTAVEAVAQGRHVVCSDLNPLACFITRAKALPMADQHLGLVEQWAQCVVTEMRKHARRQPLPVVTTDGASYAPHSYGLLTAIRDSIVDIDGEEVQQLARLIVLRTGQICFDCRQRALNPRSLLKTFSWVAKETVSKMCRYSTCARDVWEGMREGPSVTVVQSDAEHLADAVRTCLSRVSFVITSPPYPGVHVLYHRWQLRGRKEVALPYHLLGMCDGKAESYYTLGHRHEPENKTYFSRIGRIFTALNSSLVKGTPIVQIVAFAEPDWQRAAYADAMRKAGLIEVDTGMKDAIISRLVPNRRWYIRTAARTPSRREYIFIHRTGHRG